MNVEDVTIEMGPLKSEFAVFVNEVQIFSRLEQYRYPETVELVAICHKIASH